jgi:hypothetical protein
VSDGFIVCYAPYATLADEPVLAVRRGDSEITQHVTLIQIVFDWYGLRRAVNRRELPCRFSELV